jgi:hypothetical protein
MTLEYLEWVVAVVEMSTVGEVVPHRWDEGAYHHGPPSRNHLSNIHVIMHEHLVNVNANNTHEELL